jgi:hypothetical protein
MICKYLSTSRLFILSAMLFALLMASCCPPALLERSPEKQERQVEVKRHNP